MADLNISLILRLVDKATAPARAAMRAIERIGGEGLMRQANTVGRGSRMMVGGMKDISKAALTGGAVLAGYSAGMVALAGSFIRPAAQFENFRVQLTNLEGSSAGAEKAMKWIETFATKTPLQMDQTVSAYARLRAFGIDPTNGSLQAMVDTMAASGGGAETLDGMVLALGQSWTKGKLQGEEAMQLLERGVPVWDLLAKKLGKTTAEVMKMSEKGQLGRKEITMLMDAMGEKNKGASENMSKTWDGIVSNLMDYWGKFQRMVMDSGVFDFLKERLQSLLVLLNTMAEDGRLQAFADTVARALLLALNWIWAFGQGAYDVWLKVTPVLAYVAELLGGWQNMAWFGAAILMQGTIFRLIRGFAQLGGGALIAAKGILSMLSPLNLVRTAALAWIGTGIFAAVAALAMAGLFVWQNWAGLVAFFQSFGSAFRAALGPAAPVIDAIVERLISLRDWVMQIIGPIDESGEKWRHWGQVAGQAVGGMVRAIGDWVAAHPALTQAMAGVVAALGLIRLLITPVAAGWGILVKLASVLGTAAGFLFRGLMLFGRGAVLAGRGIALLVGGVKMVGQALLIAGRAALANPLILALTLIAGMAYVIYDNWSGIVSYFTGKIDRVRAAFDEGLLNGVLKLISEFNPFILIMDAATGLFTYITGWSFGDVRKALADAFGFDPFTALWDAANKFFKYITGWSFADVSTALSSAFTDIDFVKIGSDMMSSIWTGFKSIMGDFGEWMKAQLLSFIPDFSALIPGSTGQAPAGAPNRMTAYQGAMAGSAVVGRAIGGPARAGAIYRWNEQGHEMFSPTTDGVVINARQTKAMAGGRSAGRAISLSIGDINIHAAPGQSPQAIAREVTRQLEEKARSMGMGLHDGGAYV